MATKLISKYYCPYERAERKEFICDTDADFADLPSACTGSKAISLWSKKERVVNTKGRWVPYGENFVGSPIIDLAMVEGGAVELEYDKEAKFKQVITAEDFETYLANATMSSQSAIQANSTTATGMISVSKMEVGGEPVYNIQILDNENPYGATAYFINIKAMASMSEMYAGLEDGWVSVIANAETGETTTTPLSDPPSVTFPTGANMGADLETTSIFFGGGAKTVLSVTDTNDEGIVASYEVYADEALIDTVPKAETIDATALGVTTGASVTVKAKSIIDTTSEASNAVVFE